MNKLIETLTFCKRIGALELGFDQVRQALDSGRARLVLLAGDLSPKTEKELLFLCGRAGVPVEKTGLRQDEYWYLIGKRTGVIGVTHPVFAEKLRSVIESGQTGREK